MKNKDLIVIFNPQGLTLDTQETSGKTYFNEAFLADFNAAPYKALFYFGFEDRHPDMSVSLTFLHGICQGFVDSLSHDPDIEITKTVKTPDTTVFLDMLRGVPYAVGVEYVSIGWFAGLWAELAAIFKQELSAWDGTVASFLTTQNAKLNVAGRVFFHLVENKSDKYPFAFLATYSTETGEQNKAAHVPLKNALLEYKDRQDLLLKLLSAVSRAADSSDFISELVESGELFSPLQFTADEAYTFLKEIPLYEESGVMCRMPDWWKKKNAGLKVSVSIGGKAPSQIGFEALISCKPSLLWDGEEISREEIEALMSQTAGLSFLKGKWIEVDHEKLKSALEAYEKADAMGDISFADAIRMELGISKSVSHELGDTVEITNGQWLKGIRDRLTDPSLLENLKPGEGFKAKLRHYQQTGFNWLASMKGMGFGALLADDMGLGKTVQILALIEYLRRSGGSKGLLIIPASLIGNWQKELARFAPEIKYSVLHSKNTELNDESDLFITTYGMALRLEHLRARRWDVVILDEAQAIKNPATGQTKAVKQLNASFKVAMTGTPIENKLGDLWSLFDFLNTGLLGTAKEFSNYAKNIKESGSYAKLRGVVSPFVLRRLKTDKAIISDLPDKVEIKAYTTLTNKQALLYQGLIRDLEHKLETADGIERKGVVLAAIMKFKQICNHPDQYLGQAAYKATGSGKFGKLKEICETIYEKRERVLVFTQFKEMTNPLADFLGTVFTRDGLVLHGGTPVKKRAGLVDKFNGAEYVPFMVLSLKAGGVGLNLTAANHVIHFDRWWNPAVENQATDRAFRIGQTKNVMVHKFITAGTIEEKIDAMIEEKQQLSGDIIAASGENWITEMNNDQLMNLFRLEV
ncbi:MAG: DEAD/DEAH box helicase [Oscillospiraceae bacterium]|nr:DEAD/DEAH box helicase [Oscillospiraceae bacterium]